MCAFFTDQNLCLARLKCVACCSDFYKEAYLSNFQCFIFCGMQSLGCYLCNYKNMFFMLLNNFGYRSSES